MDILQYLISKDAIEKRLYRWCEIIDGRELDSLDEVFAEDVYWDFGEGIIDHSLTETKQRIVDHMGPGSQCGPTKHHITNLRIEVEDETAESNAYCYAVHQGIGEHEYDVLTVWLNYNDFWQLGEEGWRIKKRIYRVQFMEGPQEIVYSENDELTRKKS